MDRSVMARIDPRPFGDHAAVEDMALTRPQLVDELLALDAELLRLEAGGTEEEAVQAMLEHTVNTSTRTVGQGDRLWWWGQLYAVMDHRSERLVSASATAGTH
jgi:hypothetical protein